MSGGMSASEVLRRAKEMFVKRKYPEPDTAIFQYRGREAAWGFWKKAGGSLRAVTREQGLELFNRAIALAEKEGA